MRDCKANNFSVFHCSPVLLLNSPPNKESIKFTKYFAFHSTRSCFRVSIFRLFCAPFCCRLPPSRLIEIEDGQKAISTSPGIVVNSSPLIREYCRGSFDEKSSFSRNSIFAALRHRHPARTWRGAERGGEKKAFL